MADATAFNLADGQKAERKLLVTAINVADSGSTEEWEIVGVGVEDSTIEYNPDIETTTDILGITNTDIKKLEPSQDLSPFTIRGGSKLALKLYNQIKYNRLSELQMYKVMQIHAYVGTTGSYEAEVHDLCTIIPQSTGGSSNVDMPINIQYSNKKTQGTVNGYTLKDTIVFTAALGG